MLTSGTTGRYKAFGVSAAADAINVASHIEIAGLSEDARVLVCDFGLWTSAGYYVTAAVWCAGGCAVIERTPRWRGALALPHLTDAWLTPFALEHQLAAPSEGRRRRDDLRLIVGGFALSWPLAQKVLADVTTRLSSLVASTETGPWSLSPVREPDDVVWHRPHASRRVEIVDDADAPTRPGVVGRVRVRTIDGAVGYLTDDSASRVCFRNGWFYPGDMGEVSADGRVALRGRESDVIPLGGAKHAAGPFEHMLRQLLGVEELCVFSAPNHLGEEEIHVALETRQAFARDQLAKAAKAVFRGAKTARFHFVDALPRSSMGKVLRYTLKRQLTPPRSGGQAESGR